MTIFLTVLKVIGIILLVLLGIILYILIVPFFYSINIRGAGELSTIEVEGRLHSLLFFVRAAGGYVKKEVFYYAGVLWGLIKVINSAKKDKTNKNTDKDSNPDSDGSNPYNSTDEGLKTQESNPEGREMDSTGGYFEEVNIENRNSPKFSLKNILNKFKNRKLNKANKAVEKKKKSFSLNKILELNYSKLLSQSKRLLRLFRPRIIKADLIFSMGAPDTTGKACGVLSLIPGIYGKKISITPDFISDDVIFDGYVVIKGHFNLISVIYHGLKLLYYYKKK